jgi:hypothetical protein
MKRLTPIKLRKNIDYFAFFDCGTWGRCGIVDAGHGGEDQGSSNCTDLPQLTQTRKHRHGEEAEEKEEDEELMTCARSSFEDHAVSFRL